MTGICGRSLSIRNVAYLVESGVPVFSDVPWLTVSPDAGTVADGASSNLQVSVNTTGMAPGLYLATLVIQSNAANQPNYRIPVSLVVSGYVKAIEAGGKQYVDTQGETWPHAAGARCRQLGLHAEGGQHHHQEGHLGNGRSAALPDAARGSVRLSLRWRSEWRLRGEFALLRNSRRSATASDYST